MRNLKRVLSLTLASVMLLGLMVVGVGAVDYPDVDSNDNIEAIEVMGALGIFEGDDNGEFRPDEAVTRAEMAKVMATLLGLDYKHFENLHPYTDTVGHWAEAYIAACSANGVINGRGGGIYDPSATVSGVEASAMLMRAMGYFKYASDVADGFDIATISQASKIGLYSDIDASVYSGLPRNDVAQMVLNALQCSMVEVGSVATTVTTPDGTVVNTGRTEYVARTVTDRNASSTSDTNYGKIGRGWAISGGYAYTIEMGEDLYDGKLELATVAGDDYGRPATQWKYNNKAIGTYETKPDLVYTKAVKGKDIWADLGKPTVYNTSTYYSIDGSATPIDTNGKPSATGIDEEHSVISTGTKNVYGSGKGVVTQVYYYPDTYQVHLFVINTFLAKADADYDEDDDSLAISVQSSQDVAGDITKLDGEDFAISGYKADDYLLITAAKDGGTYKVQSVSPATVVPGVTVTEYKTGETGSVTTGDKKTYDYAYTFGGDTGALGYADFQDGSGYDFENGEYDLYLDQYGYVVGVEKVSGSSSMDDYLFVKDAAKVGWDIQAKVVFMDGTSKTVQVSKTAKKGGDLEEVGSVVASVGTSDITDGQLALGCFYSYKVDKNGKYELTSAGKAGVNQGMINSPGGKLAGYTYSIDPDAKNALYPIVYAHGKDTEYYYGLTNPSKDKLKPVSNKTIFITKDKVYVGLKNTPKVDWYDCDEDTSGPLNLYYMLDTDTTPSYIAAIYTGQEGKSSAKADEWFYIYSEGAVGNKYTNYSVVQGTEKSTLQVDGKSPIERMPGLYKIKGYTSDGYAEIGTTSGKDYFVAKDTDADVEQKRTSNLVYSRSLDASNFEWTAGALIIEGNYSYYLGEDAEIYRINADNKGAGVSTSAKIDAEAVGKMTSGKYDIYLVMEEEGSFTVKLAYFVRKSD